MEQTSPCLWKEENDISYPNENSKENGSEMSQSEETSRDEIRDNSLNEQNDTQIESQNKTPPLIQNRPPINTSSWQNASYIPEHMPPPIQHQSLSFDDEDYQNPPQIPRKKRSYSFDPHRVKRPMNSFLLFSNEIRPILQAKYRDKSNAQISKLVGEEWHKLEEEKKKDFVLKAEKIKEEFNKMYPNFVYTKRRRKRYNSINHPHKARYDIYPNYYYYNQYMNDQHPIMQQSYDMEGTEHFEQDYFYQSMGGGSSGGGYGLSGGPHVRHHLSSPFSMPHRGMNQYPIMNVNDEQQQRQQQQHQRDHMCMKEKSENMKVQELVKEE